MPTRQGRIAHRTSKTVEVERGGYFRRNVRLDVPLMVMGHHRTTAFTSLVMVEDLSLRLPFFDHFIVENGATSQEASVATQRNRVLMCGGQRSVQWFQNRKRQLAQQLELGSINILSHTENLLILSSEQYRIVVVSSQAKFRKQIEKLSNQRWRSLGEKRE